MKNIYKVLIIATLLVLPGIVRSQQLALEWFNRFGAEGWDYANTSTVLKNKNHVVAGTCSRYNDNDSIHIRMNKNAWMVCLDSLGNNVWEKNFRSTGFVTITSLFNNENQTYFSGLFNDTLFYDSTSFLIADTYMSSFYGIMSSEGDLYVLNKFGSEATFKDILMTSDSAGIYLLSVFSDTLKLNNSLVIPQDENNAIIYKIPFEDSGNGIEISHLSGPLLNISSLKTRDNILYFTGSFCDSIKYQDSTYFSIGQSDAYIATINLTNQNNWFKIISGNQNQIITDLTITASKDIGIIGYFQDISILQSDTLNSIGCYDIFIYLLDNGGNLKWSKRLGNISNDYGYCISSEKNNLFISGTFAYNFEIPSEYGSPVEFNSSSPFGNSFIAKFNSVGVLKASYMLPGTSEDYCASLNINNDKITAIGNFYNKLNLSAINGSIIEINSLGDKDIIVIHFDDLCKDFEIDAGNDIVVCPGGSTLLHTNEILTNFIWEPGGLPNSDMLVSEPGKYYLVGINGNGCISRDSLLITQANVIVTYAGPDTTIIAGNNLELLYASGSDSTAIWNWTSTGNGYFGNQDSLKTYYSPSYNDISVGSFQLKLDGSNICGSSADSLKVIFEKDNDGITAYPNPTQQNVTLICDQGITISNITITTQSGYVLLNNETVNNYFYTCDLASQVPGTYLFYLLTNEGLKTKVINKI